MSAPIVPKINTTDVQGQDVVSESSDDHFSSADEGTPNPARRSTDGSRSPIPITRVERVDDKAAHGEVPGTPAYQQRLTDAVPDELEIVPEGSRPRSGTQSRARSHSNLSLSRTPETPGGSPVPRLVVQRVDNKPAHGEVVGTPAHDMRMADAVPDEVRTAPSDARDGPDGHDRSAAEIDPDDSQAFFKSMWERNPDGKQAPERRRPEEHETSNDADAENDDDFGDDFDEFAQGGEADGFGDFDETEPETPATCSQEAEHAPPSSLPNTWAALPPQDLKLDLSGSHLQHAMTPYLDLIFPNSAASPPPSALPEIDMSDCSPFLSDRSLSLWQQLVSPPPMQPPNWTRSKIRRLFLVSLGVPVDLDEILPPSKQKRLVLPNINLTSPRASTAQLGRLRQGGNDSSTSVDSKTGERKKGGLKRSGTVRGAPAPPEFDSNTAMLACRTTEEALTILDDHELQHHVFTLQMLIKDAEKVHEYWLQRTDEALQTKEALEAYVENLVGFVKTRRGK